MRAYGSDRVSAADDGTIELLCRLPKEGWNARVEKTLTSSEHPGTAVWWDEAWYEVISARPFANGVRYLLAPWREEHTIRVTQSYDAASEELRAEERRKAAQRQRSRVVVALGAVITGHLPSNVQERIASELGTNAPRLTIISTLPELIAVALVLDSGVRSRLYQTPGVPLWLAFFAGYLGLDAAIRFAAAFLESRPAGSVFGLVGYAIFYFLNPRRRALPPPLIVDRPAEMVTAAAPELTTDDSIAMWQPFLGLLAPADQRRLEERHGFDYRASSMQTAIVILLFSLLGVMTSLHTLSIDVRTSAVLSLVTAGLLAAEQLYRIVRLRTRPAGSVLRFLVRPFVRKLLG